MTTRRQQYRRVQSASDIYDPQRRSDSRRDGRNATQFVSPQGRRRRYGKVGSARSIRYPPAGRGVESESSNESLNVPLELAPDEEASDGFNVYGNNSYSDRMSSSMPQIRRNGWNQRKSLSSSSLGNHNNTDNNNNTKEEGGLEGIPWSPTKGPKRAVRKMFKGSMGSPTYLRKDSVGNNSMSSVSLMGDSATPIQDSLTSMGSSSSTIPPGPSQLLAPGNAELRWNACGSSSHRKKFDEVPPAFQGLTPPTRPRPSVTASAESLPPPLTDDDDDTAEFAESTYDEIFDGQDDILIVDDRLPPAYQEAVRNEHRRKSTKGTPTTATKQETGSKSKIPKPENRQSDMQWDDQQQYDLAMNSPKHVKEGFSHANATELPPAFKFIISPSSGKKRVVAIASSSLLEEDGESGKRALTAADMDTNGYDETDMQPETGHYNTSNHESMDTNNHDDSPVPPKRSWKVKRLVSVESFNKKAREEEEDNHEDESSGLTASETEVNSIAYQEETIAYSDSPTAAKRSWKPKRVMSVDSFNRESHVQPEEPKSTKDETEASDSPKPRVRYFKTKRVLSVDSFNKKLGDSENTAAATETKSPKKQAADEEDQSGMNERPPTKKYYKVKRVISVGKFEKEQGAETVESHNSGQDTCETQAEPEPTNHAMYTESISQSPPGEETTESATASARHEESAIAQNKEGAIDASIYGYETFNDSVPNIADIIDIMPKRRRSLGALEHCLDEKTQEEKSECETSASPVPRRRHKRRGSTGALVNLFEKKRTQDEAFPNENNSSRRGSRTSLVGLWEEKTTKHKDESHTPENSSRRGPRTSLAKKWSQELLPMITKPVTPEKIEPSANENVNHQGVEEKSESCQVIDPDTGAPRTKAKRRGSAGALARKWSQELLPTMTKATVPEGLSSKEDMAKKREMRLKARACTVEKIKVDEGKLSDSALRKKRIEEELARLVKHAEEVELAGPIETKVDTALKKAIMKLAYTKKFYDVVKDEYVFFPTISHTMVDYTVFELAEFLYGAENDLLPIQYVYALLSAAEYDIFKYCADLDLEYMEKCAVDITDKKEAEKLEERQSTQDEQSGHSADESAPLSPGQRFKVPSKFHNKNPSVKQRLVKIKRAKKVRSISCLEPSDASSEAKKKTSKKEKLKGKYKRSVSTGSLKVEPASSSTPSTVRSDVDKPSKKVSKKDKVKGKFQRSSSTGALTVEPGSRALKSDKPSKKIKVSKKDKLKGKYQRSSSTGALPVETGSRALRSEFDKLSEILPPKKETAKSELVVDEAKSAARRRSRSREKKDAVSRSQSKSPEPVDKKTKPRGRSRSTGRSSDAKKKARQKARPTSVGPLDDKKKVKPRRRSRSLDPATVSKKKGSNSKRNLDSSQRSTSKSSTDKAKSKAKKPSSSAGPIDNKKKTAEKAPNASKQASQGGHLVSPKSKSKPKFQPSSKSPKKPKSTPKQRYLSTSDIDFTSSLQILLGSSEHAGSV